MTLEQAISNLKIHQQWRLGADIVMIEPKELTESIDILLKYIESSYTEEQLEQAIEMANARRARIPEEYVFIGCNRFLGICEQTWRWDTGHNFSITVIFIYF